jgi:aspartate racemase
MTLPMVGLLGGTGWPSTRAYYELINRQISLRCGGLRSAPLLLWSFDFQALLEDVDRGRGAQVFAEAADKLLHAGARYLAICSATGHLFTSEMDARRIPYLHLACACAEHLRIAGITRVGVMATRRCAEAGVIDSALVGQGIEPVYPSEMTARLIDRAIFEELQYDKAGELTREAFDRVVAEFTRAGVSEALLACTELRSSLAPRLGSMRWWDSTELHSGALVEWMLSPSPAVASAKGRP